LFDLKKQEKVLESDSKRATYLEEFYEV